MSDVAIITIPVEEWKETKAMIAGLCSQVKRLTDKDQKELLTIPEAREQFSISKTTMERYINDGIIEIVRLSDKERTKRYIKRSEIEAKLSGGVL